VLASTQVAAATETVPARLTPGGRPGRGSRMWVQHVHRAPPPASDAPGAGGRGEASHSLGMATTGRRVPAAGVLRPAGDVLTAESAAGPSGRRARHRDVRRPSSRFLLADDTRSQEMASRGVSEKTRPRAPWPLGCGLPRSRLFTAAGAGLANLDCLDRAGTTGAAWLPATGRSPEPGGPASGRAAAESVSPYVSEERTEHLGGRPQVGVEPYPVGSTDGGDQRAAATARCLASQGASTGVSCSPGAVRSTGPAVTAGSRPGASWAGRGRRPDGRHQLWSSGPGTGCTPGPPRPGRDSSSSGAGPGQGCPGSVTRQGPSWGGHQGACQVRGPEGLQDHAWARRLSALTARDGPGRRGGPVRTRRAGNHQERPK